MFDLHEMVLHPDSPRGGFSMVHETKLEHETASEVSGKKVFYGDSYSNLDLSEHPNRL